MKVKCNIAERCELECPHKKEHEWRDTKGCGKVRCEAFQTAKGEGAADYPAQVCVRVENGINTEPE